jgi:Asp-tRNA(Asn)/Glu-tRNA(Gln) amidotransferase A subunit family amidase
VNPSQLGAAEAARLIATRELTSESLVASCLERIGSRDADVKAWTCCDPEYALRQARALDGAARPLGPLHGVPLGIKDVLDTADLPTEYGSPIYREFSPRWDAACVALARAAGAVLLGKCSTAEFANNHPAPTRNPHNLAHTPGGSSSGSAAAVADAMVPLAFGTQTGGSIIRPAAYCGVVGYKPTFNLINRAGLKFVAESLDTIGLFGRNVEDVALLAGAVSGFELPSFAEPPSARPRIGLHRTPRWDQADASTRSALESAARVLGNAGAKVRDFDLPQDFGELYEEHTVIMGFEEAQAFAYEYSRHAPLLSDTLRQRIEEGMRTPRVEYESAMRHARACRDRLVRTFAGIDFVLTLSAPGEAPRGLTSTGSSLFNRTWTLLGVPCLNVPYGTGPNRLPLGVQVIGKAGSDAALLRWAHWACGVLR